MLLARLRSWIRSSLNRNELERSMHDEMQLHMELYEADLRRQGLSEAEAKRRTRVEFGSVTAAQDECREALGLRVLDEARADGRYAVRLLRRSPGFAAVALLSLGLGIGANTAIFSLVDTVLLKSLPVEDPERLFFLDNSGGKSGGSSGPPYPCFELWRDHNQFLSGIAAFDTNRFKVTIDGTPELLPVQYASGSYFDVLGIRPAHGRLLTPADDTGAGLVAVISHSLWTRQFARDPDVLGKTLLVGTHPVTIVGVTPPEFFGLQVGSPMDVTIPMALANGLRSRQLWWFSVIGRLKPDATVEQARADLERLWDGYMREIGQPPEKRTYFSGVALVPAARGLNGLRREFSLPLRIAMSIVAIVLLIGCANVANLLLARASARRNEIAVRLAIGASRGRVIRQMLTEGLVLIALGGALGLLLARVGLTFLTGLLAGDGDRALDPDFDSRLFLFTAAIATLTGVLFSLAPAIRSVRSQLTRPVTSASTPRVRLGQTLTVVQVMFSVALLCGAGLFLRTLNNLNSVDAGFQSQDVLTMQVEATVPGSNGRSSNFAQSSVEDHARLGSMWEGFVARVIALPDVSAAAVATMSPLAGRDRGVNISILSTRLPDDDRYIHVNQVTAGYFDTMGTEVVTGRPFNTRDRATAPRVAILNENAARTYFGSDNPVGRIVRFPGQRVEDPYQVVGVVRDTRYESLRKPDERMAYLPIEQSIDPIVNTMLVVRSSGDTTGLVSSIRDEARRSLPAGFVSRVVTLRQQVEASLVGERLLSILATFFGGLALALACIGLYGVMAHGVIGRTREIAVRMAIGARSDSVVWMVVRSTVGLVVVGAALGTVVALLAGRWIQALLFEVAPADPWAMSSAVVLLAVVTLAAGYLPARRATRIEPAVALRAD